MRHNSPNLMNYVSLYQLIILILQLLWSPGYALTFLTMKFVSLVTNYFVMIVTDMVEECCYTSGITSQLKCCPMIVLPTWNSFL